MNDLQETIRKTLNGRTWKSIENAGPSYVHASVLIPLFKERGIHQVLFTERTSRVEHHKGQISFPGGVVDAGDATHLETALREADEEIGLKREDVEILGRIDDAMTLASSFVVHPFVGLIRYPYPFALSRAEVKQLIKVPLTVFHPKNTRHQRNEAEYEGVIYRSIAYEYNGAVIWGATARMMQNLMDILSQLLPLPQEMESRILQ
jgi:8-oxo-dGTP pyrophosphatase MutT (NUDIX family)